MSLRVQELESLASEQVNPADAKQDPGAADGSANAEVLKTLQAEYDAYKVAQDERYTSSVTRVNATNVSCTAIQCQ